MKLALDQETRTALDLAKRSVTEDEQVDLAHLVPALYHATTLKDRLPQLSGHIPQPRRVTADPGQRHVSATLRTVLARFEEPAPPAGPAELFAAILATPAGHDLLVGLGVPDQDVQAAVQTLGGQPTATAPAQPTRWRESQERNEIVEALNAYGRTLTAIDLPPSHLHGVEKPLRQIMQGLLQRKQHSVVLVGPPGVGKSAIVHEFARRVAADDPMIHQRLRDIDVFELSPAFLKAGASVVGQFEERVKALLEILTANPQVVVFVDEVHALLQSEMHVQTPFSGASAEFKKAVGGGDISLIGCTTLLEYRHYIEPDKALADRFTQVRIEAPTAEQTVEILQARMSGLRRHYSELTIPDEIVPVTVKLAEDHLLGRYQPRKSIRLLDQACAWCLVQDPPRTEVTEEAVRTAIEAQTGHRLVESRAVTPEVLTKELLETIVGQDALMKELATAVATGLGGWTSTSKGPRGNFFFAGPTGVGKTETAKVLAAAVGGGPHALIRIDCNTLQGSGWDSQSAINTLLGAPPGFIGYVRGEGGLLSQIRDTPECVVLFDEIEKADPGVAKLLLQILDEGMVEDTDGNPLDFRRAFLVFTSNAGVTYDGSGGDVGFRAPGQAVPTTTGTAKVSEQSVMDDLRRRGFPQEFLGRNFQWFTFRSLDRDDAREILRRQLEALRGNAAQRRPPRTVDWDPTFIERFLEDWQPQFGVRNVLTLLRGRVTGQLSIAEVTGELDGVTHIRLQVASAPRAAEADARGAQVPRHGTTRRREADTLIIEID